MLIHSRIEMLAQLFLELSYCFIDFWDSIRVITINFIGNMGKMIVKVEYVLSELFRFFPWYVPSFRFQIKHLHYFLVILGQTFVRAFIHKFLECCHDKLNKIIIDLSHLFNAFFFLLAQSVQPLSYGAQMFEIVSAMLMSEPTCWAFGIAAT